MNTVQNRFKRRENHKKKTAAVFWFLLSVINSPVGEFISNFKLKIKNL